MQKCVRSVLQLVRPNEASNQIGRWSAQLTQPTRLADDPRPVRTPLCQQSPYRAYCYAEIAIFSLVMTGRLSPVLITPPNHGIEGWPEGLS